MNQGRTVEKISSNKKRKKDRQTYCANDEFGYNKDRKRKRQHSRDLKRA